MIKSSRGQNRCYVLCSEKQSFGQKLTDNDDGGACSRTQRSKMVLKSYLNFYPPKKTSNLKDTFSYHWGSFTNYVYKTR